MVFADEVKPRILNVWNIFPQLGTSVLGITVTVLRVPGLTLTQ